MLPFCCQTEIKLPQDKPSVSHFAALHSIPTPLPEVIHGKAFWLVDKSRRMRDMDLEQYMAGGAISIAGVPASPATCKHWVQEQACFLAVVPD